LPAVCQAIAEAQIDAEAPEAFMPLDQLSRARV
jgi:hypothetical protein